MRPANEGRAVGANFAYFARLAVRNVERKTARWRALAREFFWRDRCLRAATERALLPGDAGWAELRLARAALRHADVLHASRGAANPAMLLYRTAAQLVIHAQRARTGRAAERPNSAEYWPALRDSAEGRALAAQMSDDHLKLAELCLREDGESLLAQMPRERAEQAARTLRQIATCLAAPLSKEATLAARVVVSRWLRTGSALTLLIAVVLAILATILHRPNLALHRLVTVQNVDPEYSDTRRLVDGDRTNLGFHATAPPHVATIDLGRSQPVSRVVVFNRSDCCEERAIPLLIELGDRDEFQRVAERKSVFHRWQAEFPPVMARYVRLSSTNSAPFHLSEVEVY
jgi:F5/8 type C domain-containing protein